MGEIDLCHSESVQVGDRVEILQPSYLTGKVGTVLGREEIFNGHSSDRWLVQVMPDEYVVSLAVDEFRLLECL